MDARPNSGRSFKAIWPRYAKDERRAFELLREACVKARYFRHYSRDHLLECLGASVSFRLVQLGYKRLSELFDVA